MYDISIIFFVQLLRALHFPLFLRNLNPYYSSRWRYYYGSMYPTGSTKPLRVCVCAAGDFHLLTEE